MKNLTLASIRSFVVAHKAISSVAGLIIIFGGYKLVTHFTAPAAETRYLIAAAEKGTIVSTVSGTGQVSASDQVDIVPEVSGTITSVSAVLNQEVKAGDVIARIDSGDAARAVDNANLSVSNADISYQKALKASQNQAANSSISDLTKAYEDGYNAVASMFIDLPDILAGVKDIYYSPTHSPYFTDNQIQTNGNEMAITYKYNAGVLFDKAVADYEAVFPAYKSASVNSNPDTIVSLLEKTSMIAKELSAALNGTYNTIDYINSRSTGSVPAQIATDKGVLSSYLSKMNGHVTSISAALTTIENAKDSATTAELDLKSAELARGQAQATLKTAVDALANHTIRAPFDGMIAKISIQAGDKASTGSSLATIITKQKIAEISLNEIDAAKVKVGQKATLSFDAVDGLSVTGKVTEVSTLGTVSQGVVSYDIKIAFDTDDERIKIGMTTSADIATAVKQDVLTVPNGAVKTQSGAHYVEVFDSATPATAGTAGATSSTLPQRVTIEIGLSDDTSTEITSGLSEGDKVVTKTIAPTTAKAATAQAPSIFGAAGATRTAGAAGGNRTFNAVTR